MRLTISLWPNGRCSGLIGKPEGCQCHAGEAEAELLQRCAASDRLGHALGEFIEFAIHTFPFVCFRVVWFLSGSVCGAGGESSGVKVGPGTPHWQKYEAF